MNPEQIERWLAALERLTDVAEKAIILWSQEAGVEWCEDEEEGANV